MNEEIIKIIKDLEFCKGIFDYTMAPEQCGLLLNYINNLQQENHQLKDRIEKAIEYIDDIVPCIHDEELLNDLSKILKGEENEWKRLFISVI